VPGLAMNRLIPMNNTCMEPSVAVAPLVREQAWEIEALLLRVFEYGDYSLRSALSGAYAEHLDCIFSCIREDGVLVGAGAALCGRRNPTVALLGPIGVVDTHRRRGIGTTLVNSLLRNLQSRGCHAVYLGVSSGHPALRFYQRLGFVTYQGIVRRLLLDRKEDWQQTYFAPSAQVEVRPANWGDFPGVQALLCCPGSMITVDLARGVFSSRYVEPGRFLSLFPDIIRCCNRRDGRANVLVTRPAQSVGGFAYACPLPGEGQRHVGCLEFYVHDNFMDEAGALVRATLLDARRMNLRRLRCLALAADRPKRRIAKSLGGTYAAEFVASARVNDDFHDVVVYEWDMQEASPGADI
jgi:GNAT superfamily N-acetyltransferase